MRVVDWSNYQWHNVLQPQIASPDERYKAERAIMRGYFQKMVDGRVEGIIIGRQRANIWAGAMRELANEVGMQPIGEYLINVGDQWPQPFPESLFIAVDVEPGSEFVTVPDIDNALEFVRSTGKVPVLYGANWAFSQLGLAAVTKWAEAGVALWNAKYDGRADGFALQYPFAGYTTCVIDQFTEQGQVPGVPFVMDFDEIDDAWLATMRLPDLPPSPSLPTIPIRAQLDAIHAAEAEIRRLTGIK